jgi:flagella basal body P-ring formation protein FlgA
MNKFLFVVVFLWVKVVFASIEIEIDKGCFNLRDVNLSFPNKDIVCNLNYAEERKVSIQLIKSYLSKDQAKDLPSSSFIIVKRKGVDINEDLLKDMVVNILGKKFPSLRFEIVKINSGNRITASNKNDIEISFSDKYFGSVYLDIKNGVKSYNVYAYIKAYAKGFVSTERIEKGDIVGDKIKEADVEITNLKDDLFLNNFSAVANQNIPKNRVITMKMIKSMPSKTKGEKVKVVYKNDNIILEFEGVLMEDAHQNQKVSIKNSSSDKVLTGVYKDGNVFVE